jgi:adenylosuccinate synthase
MGNRCTIVVGGQYGDEGKGKIISHLALNDKPEIIARGGVGPNAGHQVKHNGTVYSLRMVPSGFIYDKARLLIGAGVLVSPTVFLNEVQNFGLDGRIGIDKRCTAILQKHIDADKGDNSKKIGTTGTGCGPAQMDRVTRTAVLCSEVPELAKYITDVPREVNACDNVLIEGTQGFMLSVLYGTYPFVTSKDTSASTMAADVGIGPRKVTDVVLVAKAYTTRVGNGPFPGEISIDDAVKLGYQEYGTVTRRPRRTSKELHFDDLRLAVTINSANHIAITKLDVRFPAAAGINDYDKLPKEAKAFIENIESKLEVPVTLIGTGADSTAIIDRRKK